MLAIQRVNEQLTGDPESRVVIEPAKGVIAERAGVDVAVAFSRLRRSARNHNLGLTDVGQASFHGGGDYRGAASTTSRPVDGLAGGFSGASTGRWVYGVDDTVRSLSCWVSFGWPGSDARDPGNA